MIDPINTTELSNSLNLRDKNYIDFHSMNSIVFGSLIEDGWDWGRQDWKAYTISDEYTELIRPRINEKIEDKFFYRELGQLPPARFKRHLKTHIQNAVSKYGFLYTAIIDKIDISIIGKISEKERTIISEFPQSQLQPDSQDYASNAKDHEILRTETGNYAENLRNFYESFEDPDSKVLEELEPCFSKLITFEF